MEDYFKKNNQFNINKIFIKNKHHQELQVTKLINLIDKLIFKFLFKILIVLKIIMWKQLKEVISQQGLQMEVIILQIFQPLRTLLLIKVIMDIIKIDKDKLIWATIIKMIFKNESMVLDNIHRINKKLKRFHWMIIYDILILL